LKTEEINQFNVDMAKQWEETRLPTVGRNSIQTMISNWHAAPATPQHCPENMKQQLYRCTVSLSGQDGKDFIQTHQKEIACGKSNMIPTENGLIYDAHIYPAFNNTVFIAHGVRMNKLRQQAQNM
jgi:hypothetical protein